MLKIKNIEGGLHTTMVAVFRKQGLSETAATAKAAKNLGGALEKFNEAQSRSAEQPPARDDLTARLRLRAASSARAARSKIKVGGQIGKSSIKTASKKITSAEQVALHKVSGAPSSKSFVASKTSASVAIALGAVATWARKLP